MKKTIKLAVVAALALGATSVFATNGDNMIGQAAQSRSMGGVGIAKSFGAASGLSNPALLSSVEKSEITGALTFFMPDVAATSKFGGTQGTLTDSKADFSVIPELYYATRVNSNLVYGITVAGTAGMGTDYKDTTAAATSANVAKMYTELALMKIAIPLSYNINELTLGVAPVLQYGTLDIRHNGLTASGVTGPQNNNNSDTGIGYELGLSYDVSPALNFGVVYKSKIKMAYAGVLSKSIASFAQSANITSGDNLDQPSEYGVGTSYTSGANTISIDYKRIEWGSAAGYKDFGWVDQDVVSIGYEYATKTWALRAGYNHSKSPIAEQASGATKKGDTQNFFNLAGFPGIVESHYTFGAGYNMSDDLSLDLAVVYAAEEKNSFAVDQYAGAGGKIDVVHSQLGVTVAATYEF